MILKKVSKKSIQKKNIKFYVHKANAKSKIVIDLILKTFHKNENIVSYKNIERMKMISELKMLKQP